MGHETVGTTRSFYGMVKQDELRRRGNEFSTRETMAWEERMPLDGGEPLDTRLAMPG